MTKGYGWSELKQGQSYTEDFLVTEEMGAAFAGLSGDVNPVHLDEDYAMKTRFQGRIAHGMLIGGFISNVIGTKLPGEGCIYLKQDMTFLKPVRYGDTVRVQVIVEQLLPEKKRVLLVTDCYNQNQEKVLTGKALVMPKEEN